MKNFWREVFPSEYYDDARLHKTITWQEVSDRVDLIGCIRDFFRCLHCVGIRAKNALQAVIIFFGHGKEQGFSAGPEEIMALDDITCLVKEEFRQALSQKPDELPAMVEIIFTQCFGYCYNPEVETGRFKVIALANKGCPVTLSIVDDATGESFIHELHKHVENTMRQQVTEREAWRNPEVQNPTAPPAEREETPMDMGPETTDDGYQSMMP